MEYISPYAHGMPNILPSSPSCVSAVGSGERSHEEVCPGATVSGRGERLETQFTSSSSAGRPQPFQGV